MDGGHVLIAIVAVRARKSQGPFEWFDPQRRWPCDAACYAAGVAGDSTTGATAAMNRYADGDATAFEDLYDQLAPRLIGFLFRLTGDRGTAEDLVQQTFLQIHDSRSRFTPGADVHPWAMAIARRLFIDMVRRVKSRRTDLVASDILEGVPAVAAASPKDWAIARETEAAIDSALTELTSREREAFKLVKEEGLSLADAAAVLGTTVAAVKLRTHRAYGHVRKSLAPTGSS